MFSEEQKQKFRELAIKNGLGGKNRIAEYYTDQQLQELAINYSKTQNKLTSVLFPAKIHKTENAWKQEVGAKVIKDCRYKLYYYIDFFSKTLKKCIECSIEHSIEQYQINQLKRCRSCTKLKRWKQKKHPNAGLKISNSKKIWFQTEEGKICAKKVGNINSEKMKAFNLTEKGKSNLKSTAEKNSVIMKRKIANGLFVPCITNSWTHWSAFAIINNEERKYRSSWEACFAICNSDLLYEKFRIPYIDESIMAEHI